MTLVPRFTTAGVLPVGDYLLTLDELRVSYLATGEGTDSATWDGAWRGHLVDNLEIVVGRLWQVGIDRVFVNGSFVEEKDHPNDIDGYFECDVRYFASGQLQRDLNASEGADVWTWHPVRRIPDPNSGKRQLPIWHRYRVELYPHFPELLSGIRDAFGNELEFPSAFRLSRRAYEPKGIVRIIRDPAERAPQGGGA
jgi:Family of unknown function (DUF6932)